MRPLELAFSKTIENYQALIEEKGCVIIGYSGGADSSCLLRLMSNWCAKHDIRLIAAHVNHMIRGKDADSDEEFCRNICVELGIEFYSKKIDVPALASQNKSGLEETARRIRYEFFDEISEKITGDAHSTIIATAHNADDNLETVLFHMLRGSGLHGLGGISPLRDGRYLRPLLYDSGAAIRDWCANNCIPYRIDSTNADTDYARNHIRHNIVPRLAEICENPAAAVSRMTTLLRQDDDYLEHEARRHINNGDVTISREKLLSLHPSIASRVLLMLYNNAKDSAATIEEIHIRQALQLSQTRPGSAMLSLPGKMLYCQDRHMIYIKPDSVRRGAMPKTAEIPDESPIFSYPTDGAFFKNELYTICFSHNEHNCHITDDNIDENIYKLSILTTLRFDKILGVLRIRYKFPGDVCYYGGHTHKVKRMFSDRKLTEREKKLCPILYDDSGIVWIPGFPPRDGMLYKDEGDALFVKVSIL